MSTYCGANTLAVKKSLRRETIPNPRATPRFYLTAVEKQMHDRIWEWPWEEVKETLQAEVRNFALYFIEGYYVDRRR